MTLTTNVDPFAEDPIIRDQYGRPRIIPIKRGKPDLKGKLIGYTRASTYADAISDAGGLVKWSKWHLALGLGRNPDLAALAGAFGPTVDDLSRADKAALDQIIERAHDRSGGNVKADYGTAVHAYTEPGALAVPDPFGAAQLAEDYRNATAAIEQAHREALASIARDAVAYHATMQRYGLETVATEEFVVNDDLQCAGTFDHLVRTTRELVFTDKDGAVLATIPAGTVLVLDKKTGKLHFDSQSIQLAVYANAKRHNPETGERTPLGASFEWGILAHIPKGEGRCDLHLIDLRVGWAAAKLAGKVREHRTRRDIGLPFPTVEPSEPVAPALSVVPSGIVESVAVAQIGDTVTVGGIEFTKVSESPFPAAPETVEDALAVVIDIFGPVEVIPTVIDKLNNAADRDELSAIWREHKAEWSDEHTAALRARAAQLEQAA